MALCRIWTLDLDQPFANLVWFTDKLYVIWVTSFSQFFFLSFMQILCRCLSILHLPASWALILHCRNSAKIRLTVIWVLSGCFRDDHLTLAVLFAWFWDHFIVLRVEDAWWFVAVRRRVLLLQVDFDAVRVVHDLSFDVYILALNQGRRVFPEFNYSLLMSIVWKWEIRRIGSILLSSTKITFSGRKSLLFSIVTL